MSGVKSTRDVAVEYYGEFSKEFDYYSKKADEVQAMIDNYDQQIDDIKDEITCRRNKIVELESKKLFLKKDLDQILEDKTDCDCMRVIVKDFITREYPYIKLD